MPLLWSLYLVLLRQVRHAAPQGEIADHRVAAFCLWARRVISAVAVAAGLALVAITIILIILSWQEPTDFLMVLVGAIPITFWALVAAAGFAELRSALPLKQPSHVARQWRAFICAAAASLLGILLSWGTVEFFVTILRNGLAGNEGVGFLLLWFWFLDLVLLRQVRHAASQAEIPDHRVAAFCLWARRLTSGLAVAASLALFAIAIILWWQEPPDSLPVLRLLCYLMSASLYAAVVAAGFVELWKALPLKQPSHVARQWRAVIWAAAASLFGILLTWGTVEFIVVILRNGLAGNEGIGLLLLWFWFLDLVLLRQVRHAAPQGEIPDHRVAAFCIWARRLTSGLAAAVGLATGIAVRGCILLTFWAAVAAAGFLELQKALPAKQPSHVARQWRAFIWAAAASLLGILLTWRTVEFIVVILRNGLAGKEGIGLLLLWFWFLDLVLLRQVRHAAPQGEIPDRRVAAFCLWARRLTSGLAAAVGLATAIAVRGCILLTFWAAVAAAGFVELWKALPRKASGQEPT